MTLNVEKDLLYYEGRRRSASKLQKALNRRSLTAEERRTIADLLLSHELDLRQKVRNLADELQLSTAQCDDLYESNGLRT